MAQNCWAPKPIKPRRTKHSEGTPRSKIKSNQEATNKEFLQWPNERDSSARVKEARPLHKQLKACRKSHARLNAGKQEVKVTQGIHNRVQSMVECLHYKLGYSTSLEMTHIRISTSVSQSLKVSNAPQKPSILCKLRSFLPMKWPPRGLLIMAQ